MHTNFILDFRKYKYQHWVTLLVFLAAIVLIYLSIKSLLNTDTTSVLDFMKEKPNMFYVVAWVFGPPSWFFFEYFVLWHNAGPAKREQLKAARELAQPFWAAALYFLFLLVPS